MQGIRAKPPREFWKRPEGFITHARGHYLWAPLRTGKKRTEDRQGGGNGRVEVERKEVETKKKKKKGKKDRYRAPWNFTNERSQLT